MWLRSSCRLSSSFLCSHVLERSSCLPQSSQFLSRFSARMFFGAEFGDKALEKGCHWNRGGHAEPCHGHAFLCVRAKRADDTTGVVQPQHTADCSPKAYLADVHGESETSLYGNLSESLELGPGSGGCWCGTPIKDLVANFVECFVMALIMALVSKSVLGQPSYPAVPGSPPPATCRLLASSNSSTATLSVKVGSWQRLRFRKEERHAGPSPPT